MAALGSAAPAAFSFEAVVGALFSRLDLGVPRFDATGIVRLRVDDGSVNLLDDGRGHVLVEAVAGRVPEDASARRVWRAAFLRQVPGLLLVNEAGLFLRRQASAQMLIAQGRYRLRSGELEHLEQLIEDVLAQAERHGRLLGDASRAAPRASVPAPETESEVMIFRL